MGTTCTIIPDRFRGIKPSPLVCANERGGREGGSWFFVVAATKREYRIEVYHVIYVYICALDDKNFFLHSFISFIIILYELYYRIISILGRIVINLFIKFRNYFFRKIKNRPAVLRTLQFDNNDNLIIHSSKIRNKSIIYDITTEG